jgi:hypothetical protein
VQVLHLDTTGVSDGAAHLALRSLTVRNENVTLVSGDANGGGLLAQTTAANLTVEGCTFSNNTLVSSGTNGSAFGAGANISSSNSATTTSGYANTYGRAEGGGFVTSVESGNIIAQDNTFVENTASSSDNMAQGGGAYTYSTAASTSFVRNTFRDNAANGAGTGKGGGLRPGTNSGSITLINNIFRTNQVSGVDQAQGGGALCWVSTGSLTATNNTFTGNSAGLNGGGLHVHSEDAGGAADIYNNVIWGNVAGAGGNDGDDLAVEYAGLTVRLYNNALGVSSDFTTASSEVLWVQNTAGYTQGNNTTTDPLLDANGFLLTGSPCIDTGDNAAPSVPADDIEGDARPFDGNGDTIATVDRGADEYLGPRPGQEHGIPSLGGAGMAALVLLTALGGAVALARRS